MPVIDESHAGLRLDAYVAEAAGISRSRAAALIDDGFVTKNGLTVPKKTAVKAGDSVEITLPEAEELTEALPEDIPLDIVYEDSDLLVINKPSGMVVHPAPGNEHGTLVNALLHHCEGGLSGIGGKIRPGIVHRIDKDTSGLLVVAKNDMAHAGLSAQLSGHHITREYHALALGGFKVQSGTVDLPIGRHPQDRKKMAVITDGRGTAREAVTHYEVLEQFRGITYLKLNLETGRTHQIRVHMSYLGHPLLGDTVYGAGNTRFEKLHHALLDGQMLHAKRLTFTHPRTGERMTFECELPDNFKKMLVILKQECGQE
ncbi:MAG: RluA family pseudouridine synthase [Clostridia bacterium]|nr:RluA family pseudouridine synthase [Clostridia bacterium]